MRWCLLALLVLLSLAPSRALAWADATVRSASAQVTIDEHAHAHVTIDATLRIDGGWLEALELDGLDAGLVLDPLDPVTMAPAPTPEALLVGATVTPLAPSVSLRDDGVVVLAFTRRHAPRRGDYVVHVAYDAELVGRAHADEGGTHLEWTFPAWRHGLDSVRVELTTPTGMRPVLGADDEIDLTEVTDGAVTIWTLTRAHLARTREWPIDLAVDDGVLAFDVAASEAPVELASPTAVPSAPRPPWQGALLLALASVMVALRALRTSVIETRERTTLRPLLPLPGVVRALVALALGAALMGVALVGEDARWLAALATALVLVGLSRGRPMQAPPRIGSFRHATTSVRRAARRATVWHHVGLDAWLDASAAAGALMLFALVAAATRVPGPAIGAASVALAVMLATALGQPRLARPEPSLVALGRLVALARRARVSLEGPSIALMPVVHLDATGFAQDARLRVLAALPEGTLRADVVITRRGLLGARYGLLVVVARGSAIDRALEGDPAFETVATGSGRIARLTRLDRTGIDGAVARVLRAMPVAAPLETTKVETTKVETLPTVAA